MVEDVIRGLVVSMTAVGVEINQKAATVNGNFAVVDLPRVQAPPKPRNMVHVITNDEELIPVKKKLLTPCIRLAAYVCEGKGKYEIVNAEDEAPKVELSFCDCCEFDRVLLYLEADAKGQGEAFKLTPGEEDVLLPIAERLGLQALQDLCLKRKGAFTERVRKEGIRWEEVVQRNKGGECIIFVDGMVFDITRYRRCVYRRM